MSITPEKKLLLAKFHNFYCEQCKKKFDIKDLEIHRIRRGCSYKEHRSLMVVCKKCHKLIHSREFNSL